MRGARCAARKARRAAENGTKLQESVAKKRKADTSDDVALPPTKKVMKATAAAVKKEKAQPEVQEGSEASAAPKKRKGDSAAAGAVVGSEQKISKASAPKNKKPPQSAAPVRGDQVLAAEDAQGAEGVEDAEEPGSRDEEKRPECCLAAAALQALGTARQSGTRPPRLAPDRSCLPPRQLCRHLPRGTCTPAEEPTRPVTRSSPAYGRRSAVVLEVE